MSDSSKPQRLLLAGSRGCIGRAFLAYMKREHPEVGITPILPFPFSLQALAGHLQGATYSHFVNAASLGDDSASLADPYAYFDTNVTGVLNQLEMIRRYSPTTRFVNLGTIFEDDPARRSPYTQSKRMVRELVKSYRENHGIYAVTATLGFTEYPGRGEQYLARRITKGVARIAVAIKCGEPFEPIGLRDIDQKFQWTFAEDVADGIWRMLNQEYFNQKYTPPVNGATLCYASPEDLFSDYTLIAPEPHSVREFVEKAFRAAGCDCQWAKRRDFQGECYEIFYDCDWCEGDDPDGEKVIGPCVDVAVSTDGRGGHLAKEALDHGDSTRARTELNWSPKHTFDDIVREMMRADLREVGL